jgi:hypothetical protein
MVSAKNAEVTLIRNAAMENANQNAEILIMICVVRVEILNVLNAVHCSETSLIQRSIPEIQFLFAKEDVRVNVL